MFYHLDMDNRNYVQLLIGRLVRDFADSNQSVASKKTGFPQRTIGRWMNGESSPSMEDFLTFCQKLNQTPWKVLQSDETKEKNDEAACLLNEIAEKIGQYYRDKN